MTGVRTTCRDNPPTGRQGCGAPYRGRQLHCVAPAVWSSHADGLCHETFGGEVGCDLHLGVARDGAIWHLDPRAVGKLHQDDAGVWRQARPQAFAVAGADAISSPPSPGGGR